MSLPPDLLIRLWANPRGRGSAGRPAPPGTVRDIMSVDGVRATPRRSLSRLLERPFHLRERSVDAVDAVRAEALGRDPPPGARSFGMEGNGASSLPGLA